MNSGDTAWMLMATAMVMIMLPGLALFYGGLVRSKNVLSTVMHSWFGLALVSIVWVVIGFTLAFGPDVNGMGLIGGLDFAFFNNVGMEPSTIYAVTIPFVLYGIFRYLYLVHTKHEGGSPEEVLLRDIPIMLTLIGWVVTAGVVLLVARG